MDADEEVPAELVDDDDDAPLLVVVDDDDDYNGPAEEIQIEKSPACPVTILSGFLGAGKTTLIQYILRSPDHGKRIAVIENEFGGGEGLSVESLIARDGAANESLTDLIELPNGCVCCTVKDDLVTTLENLLEKRPTLDYILIEASGMANPGPIASIFWLDDAVESRLRLDGVVTLVDGLNIGRQLEETEEAAQQIAYADRILLNKTDLLNETKLEQAMTAVRAISPTAPMRSTSYAQVPNLNWILDTKSFSSTLGEASNPDSAVAYCLPTTDSQPLSWERHKHTGSITTTSLYQQGSVDMRRINAWIADLLWPNQDEDDEVLKARLDLDVHNSDSTRTSNIHQDTMQLFRIKGILSLQSASDREGDQNLSFLDDNGLDRRRYIVQAVYDLFDIHPASESLEWSENEERACKLIIIGRNLQLDELDRGFQSCFVSKVP